jgi:hypothetical protein
VHLVGLVHVCISRCTIRKMQSSKCCLSTLTHFTLTINFDVSLTVHLSITLPNVQLEAQIFNTFITILYMYMSRAISCSSSGGQIILIQHLVSSLSDSPVHFDELLYICVFFENLLRKFQFLLSRNGLPVISQTVHRTVTYWEWRYQMLYWYNFASWGWAKYCSKLVNVENCNKRIKNLCIKLVIGQDLPESLHILSLTGDVIILRAALLFLSIECQITYEAQGTPWRGYKYRTLLLQNDYRER